MRHCRQWNLERWLLLHVVFMSSMVGNCSSFISSVPSVKHWSPRGDTAASFTIFRDSAQHPRLSLSLAGKGEDDIYQQREDIMDKARRRRQRVRETPLSQPWYKQRQRVITPAQRRTIRELWSEYGVDMQYGQLLSVDEIFGREGAFTVLDIGFGSGTSLVSMAAAFPEANFLGVEIHKASIAAALAAMKDRQLPNVKVVRGDASLLLQDYLPPACLDQVCVFFPDPWGGKYDEGRRIVRDSTLELLEQRMREGGRLWIATDVEDYAEHVRQLLETSGTSSGRRGAWELLDEHRHPAGERWSGATPSRSDGRGAEGGGGGTGSEGQVRGDVETQGLREGDEGNLKSLGSAAGPGREQPASGSESPAERPGLAAGFKLAGYVRPVTKYEAKAEEEGRPVWEFLLQLGPRPGPILPVGPEKEDALRSHPS